MSQVPRSAADPRPGGRPYYIALECPTCGTPLVLLDQFEHPSAADTEIWYDEWICPRCRGGIWLDWPAGEWAELEAAVSASMEAGDVMSLEDLRAHNP